LSTQLNISSIVSRTGVAEPTLRMWERRYGFPKPTRTPSGHRRYTEAHVEQVQRVLAGRAAGLSLKAAVQRAQRAEPPESLSVFATLRRRLPKLQPRLISKRGMIALSHAIEDECLAQAQDQVLFGCFQRERFYRHDEARWKELSQVAVTAVLAEFDRPAKPEHKPVEVPILGLPALSREWALLCYGERSAICLAGREPAFSSTESASSARAFEAVWTVDGQVVRELASECARFVSEVAPEVGKRASPILALEAAVGAEEQLRLATAVIDRTLSQLD
jgi:DICT domain-containing protein